MFPPVLLPYLIGVVTAPLLAKVARPLVHGTVKTTIGLGLQAKRLATEAVEDLQDLSAEMSAEISAEEATQRGTATQAGSGSKPGTRTGGGAAKTS